MFVMKGNLSQLLKLPWSDVSRTQLKRRLFVILLLPPAPSFQLIPYTSPDRAVARSPQLRINNHRRSRRDIPPQIRRCARQTGALRPAAHRPRAVKEH
jgi:hypothetical protein